eukprot:185065_1
MSAPNINLEMVYNSYASNESFESIIPNGIDASQALETILNAIDTRIIRILNGVIANELYFDIAFIHIHVLLYYATQKVNEVILSGANDVLMGYYHFLFYFLIFGCCLGTKYTKYMMLPTEHPFPSNRHRVFRYFVEKWSNHEWPWQIHYKYCGGQRQAIIDNIHHRDIALLVADYTSFEFEHFLHHIINYCINGGAFSFHNTECGAKQIDAYWNSWCFPRVNGSSTYIIQKLLLCPSFISEDCTHLVYFANEMLFKSVWRKPRSTHCRQIRNLYCNHMTIKPWNDAAFFMELLEGYSACMQQQFGGSTHTILVNILEKCMDRQTDFDYSQFTTHSPVSIFFCGNYELRKQMDDKTQGMMDKEIDYLFYELIVKHCLSHNNVRILDSLFQQMYRCRSALELNGDAAIMITNKMNLMIRIVHNALTYYKQECHPNISALNATYVQYLLSFVNVKALKNSINDGTRMNID